MPAPEVLPALVMPFAPWITWLDGVTRQANGRMCGLPPANSFSQLARTPDLTISGVRIQKLPLTPRPPLFAAPGAEFGLPNSVFGIVFHDTYRQALFNSGLSWLSFSRSRFYRGIPEPGSRSGFGCHQPKGSPRRRTLHEPAITAGPSPVGGFAANYGRSPTSAHDVLDRSVEVFPHRPHSRSNAIG